MDSRKAPSAEAHHRVGSMILAIGWAAQMFAYQTECHHSFGLLSSLIWVEVQFHRSTDFLRLDVLGGSDFPR